MARALSPAEFLDTAEKSKLLGPAILEPFRGSVERYATADALAETLVAEGLLTRFQADHLRQGKHQGFFLGTYKVLDKLGAGGSALVYLAEHVRLKQRVALKVLSSQKAGDAVALGRFEREAKAAAAVRHPNVVHAFDVATAGRVHYIVMEYVSGTTLLKALADGGRMAPKRVAGLMHQASQGLHAAHGAGIVHRDVKPSNLMIDADGVVKVMDLGLARYAADETMLTQGKAVLGIAAYSAPEQLLENATVDARADVYALGATFWLAATGKRPSAAGPRSPAAPAPPAPPARTPDEAADYRKLIGVLERMMAREPRDRYQSMADVAMALSVSGLVADETPAGSRAVAVHAAARTTADRPAPVAVKPPPAPPPILPVPFAFGPTSPASALTETPEPVATPRPAWGRAAEPAPADDTDIASADGFPGLFDFAPPGLTEELERAVEAIQSKEERQRAAENFRRQFRKWAIAGGTFAAVLVLLLLLAR